jgi:hypothetical protein
VVFDAVLALTLAVVSLSVVGTEDGSAVDAAGVCWSFYCGSAGGSTPLASGNR